MDIKIGDEFRCKRRGHFVKVASLGYRIVTGEFIAAYYKNSRGAEIRIPTSRLLSPSRFERLTTVADIVPVASTNKVAA